MTEDLNLLRILLDTPMGTKLYSPLYGDVELIEVDCTYEIILVKTAVTAIRAIFFKDGTVRTSSENGEVWASSECLLFPSRENKDWSTFQTPKPKPKPQFKPFQKVLVRDKDDDVWRAKHFSDFLNEEEYQYGCTDDIGYIQCIPFKGNEELLLTTNKPKED